MPTWVGGSGPAKQSLLLLAKQMKVLHQHTHRYDGSGMGMEGERNTFWEGMARRLKGFLQNGRFAIFCFGNFLRVPFLCVCALLGL
eukprot:5547470-Amphidinium_carterae.1